MFGENGVWYTMRFGRKGFTLIEMLVVLAIIMLLAAILYPVFERAQENAIRTNCQSNLKQIGLAFEQYVQDSDERYPPAFNDLNGNGTYTPTASASTNDVPWISGSTPYTSCANGICDIGWVDSLQPFVKSFDVFQCPNDKADPPPSGYIWDNAYDNNTDYWYNPAFWPTVGTVRHKSQLSFPSMTVLLGEGSNRPGVRYTANAFMINFAAVGVAKAGNLSAADRHLNGANYLFSDGHVKWLSATSANGADQLWNDKLTETSTPKLGAVYSLTIR